jgi:hypothetical protein
MLEIIEWLIRVALAVPYIVMAASLITALTPTPADDAIVGKAYRIIEWCALVIGKAKDK